MMAAEKNASVILSISPYRETSAILRLFTREHGLIHGIAKGVRKAGKSSVPLDRGFLLESLIYCRPNRELHTLGSMHIADFFPGIRSDITKSAIRDIALELYLKTITQSEPHPELFELIVDFLTEMDGSAAPEAFFPLLWQFIGDYCRLMGFGINTDMGAHADGRIVSAPAGANGPDSAVKHLRAAERIRVTELLLRYCRRHFDVRGPFNSLEFVKSM